MISLNIGSGPIVEEGSINIDLYPMDGVDVCADIFALPFADNSVNKVRLDHILEHLPMRRVQTALHEVRRVLCVGGTLTIGVPDFEAIVCEWFSLGIDDLRSRMMLMRNIYGNQEHEGEFHKCCFDAHILANMVEYERFWILYIGEDKERSWEKNCIRVTCRKLN